ncbi:hypothetical protein DUZ99_11975 [Xylanibacillus composti]|uniref:Uncharacterized protein n=1 Tax=Xylanibacillus composti TaxID=1572762 RepID=A0A8J4H8U4_9BACL|nr:hypothetical protein [Xylanibacillus composti]MDT9725691.1 hypothetical protein [Xylanibacillus composti]GIQ71168.1 hypothetical protein XYCOK13_39920 [Xylanibacillus composti]
MLKYIIFIVVSCMEYLGIFALMFSAFKINYKWYKAEMLFVCVSLSGVSLVMRESGLTMYTAITQMLLWVLFSWLLFRFNLLHAAVITVVGYLSYAVIQFFIGGVMLLFVPSLEHMSVMMHVLALLSAMSALGVAYYVRLRNWGFTFVPAEQPSRVKYRDKENLYLIVGNFLAFFCFFVTYFLWISYDSTRVLLITLLTVFVNLTVLIYLSTRMEIRKYSKKRPYVK